MNGFTLWVGLGAAIGLWRVARSAPTRYASALVNSGIIVLLSALFGARLAYILINWGYFSDHLIEALYLWGGGLAWEGAVAGAWFGLAALSHTTRTARGSPVPIGWFGDRLFPLLMPLAVTTWLGCWMLGSGYGPLAPEGAWWGIPAADETGIALRRLPLQLLAAASLLVFFAALESRADSIRRVGRLSFFAMAGLLVHLLAVSLLRADPGPVWQGMRLETWVAGVYILFLLVFVLGNALLARFGRNPSFSKLQKA